MSPAPAARAWAGRIEAAVGAALIFIWGLVYRGTFLYQGYNATDEGWLQDEGRRILHGQVPYRDFNFWFPPVSIYKEAGLQLAFGSSYTLLVSRWAFAVEATLGSVLAYLILRRFVSTRAAFLLALPTTFFSVLSYYFANYTYDGVVLLLLSFLLLTYADTRPLMAVAAGVAACMAFLSKPTFVAVVVAMLAVGLIARRLSHDIHPALAGIGRYWWQFLAGFAVTFVVVLGAFSILGGGSAFVQQAFLLSSQTNPQPLSYVLWQDLPTAFTKRDLELFALVGALLVVAALAWNLLLRLGFLLAVPVALAYLFSRHHDPGDFVPMAMGLLLVMNAVGLAIALAVRLPRLGELRHLIALRDQLPPPELLIFALALQYSAQFTFSGIMYSYIGAYLSLPMALILLDRIARASIPAGAWSALRLLPAIAPLGVGLWIIVAAVLYVQSTVYFDYPRSQLTASFKTHGLSGVSSNPATVMRVDGLVELIDQRTGPGDAIFVAPEFASLYLLADRRNPTRQDWYEAVQLTPAMVAQSISDLRRDPPKLVILETRPETDFSRTWSTPFDYNAGRVSPIFQYLLATFHTVELVGDVQVMVPN